MTTLSFLRDTIGIDTIGQVRGSPRNNGTVHEYIARYGFFYTSGGTSEKLATRIQKAIPSATILGHGEIWKPFRGGTSVANQSHWYVRFLVDDEKIQNMRDERNAPAHP